MASTSTMTINVERGALEEFRSVVERVYGKAKGSLGKAVTEALTMWAHSRKKKTAEETFWEMIDKGYDLGGLAYRHRSELYDRK